MAKGLDHIALKKRALVTHLLEEGRVVDEHTVHSALVAVEEPHRLVLIPHLDLQNQVEISLAEMCKFRKLKNVY